MPEKKTFFLSQLNEHLQYIKNIEGALEGVCEFKGCGFNDCQLGRWLYGSGIEEILSLKNSCALKMFNHLFDTHKKFHEAGDLALLEKAQGSSVPAYQFLSEMQVLCSHIIKILLDLDDIVYAASEKQGRLSGDLKGAA